MSSPTPTLSTYTPVNAAVFAKRTTIMLAILAAGIALAGGFGFFLINSQIQDQMKVQADRQSQVGTAQQIASRDESAHAANAAAQAQLRYISDPVDIKSYVPTLLPQIEALAKSYNLQVTSITPGPISAPPTAAAPQPGAGSSGAPGAPSGAAASAAPAYETMSLAINLSGPYPEVMKYIYGLTRFPKVVSVKGIGLHPTTNGPTSTAADKVNVTLQMVAYVFSPTQAIGGTSTGPSTQSTVPSAPASTTTAPSAMPTPAEARPMHGAMLPPTMNNPLPTPAGIKALNQSKSGATSVNSHSSAH